MFIGAITLTSIIMCLYIMKLLKKDKFLISIISVIATIFIISASIILKKRYGLGLDLYVYIFTLALLTICSIKDIKQKQVSYRVVGIAGILGIILFPFNPIASALSVLAGLMVGISIMILSYITKGAVGMGDGVLIGILGVILGFRLNLLILFYALFMSAIFGVALLITKRGNKKSEIPFIPFLLISATIMFLS